MQILQRLNKIIFLCIFQFIAFSCTEKPNNTIRIGLLQGPTAISFAYMMANPPRIEGKKIEFIIKNDPQQIQAMMMRNEVEFAVLPTVMAANLYNKGLDYTMVACPIWGTMYILSNEPKTLVTNNLSNKKVSIFGQGATPDVLFQQFIQAKNITNIKLDYSFSTNNDLALALLQGKVENAVISEPLVSTLLQKNSKIHIISKLDFQDYLGKSDKDIFTQTAFVVNKKFSKNYPNTMHMICKTYAESCNYVNLEPEKTAEILVQNKIFTDKKTSIISLPLCNIHYVASFAIEQEINKYLSLFFNFNPNTIGNKMPDRGFIFQEH
ncbi:MAG: ABC transporter substrate-binding protein [Paludibacter sp.]